MRLCIILLSIILCLGGEVSCHEILEDYKAEAKWHYEMAQDALKS